MRDDQRAVAPDTPMQSDAALSAAATQAAEPAKGGQGGLPAGLITAIIALTLMGPFTSDAVVPALPALAEDFGVSADRVQLTITASTFGVAIGQLILGTLSDAWGRRKLLIFGGIGMVVSAVLAALAPSIELLIAASFLLGLTAASGLALGRAVLADRLTGGTLNRAYSLWGAVIGVAPMFAAVGGALLLTFTGWRSIFWVLAVLGAVTLLLTVTMVPETHPAERRVSTSARSFVSAIGEVIRSRQFLAGSFIMWFGFAAVFAYTAASPFILQTMLGMSALTFSLVLAIDGVWLIITGVIAAKLATVVPPRRLVVIGLAIASAGAGIALGSVVFDSVSVWTVVASIWLVGGSMGFVFGSATTLAVIGLTHLAGTAIAVLGAMQFVFAGIAAPLVGVAGERSAVPYAVVLTACVLGAWVACAIVRPISVEEAAEAEAEAH